MGALSSRVRVPVTLAGMKTDALISLCGRLLLALMLAAPAGVALSPSPAMAQAAPAAASDKDKAAQGGNANAAAANPAPAPASPIPPANVVSRAESEENALNIIRNRLQASPQRDGIKQRLARLARDTAEARTLSHLAMDSDSQRRMRDIEPTWAQLQAEVTAVDKQLTQVAEALQEDFNRLNAMQKAWEGAQAAEEIKASPQVIRTRVQEVLNQIQDTRKAASKIRSGIFDLQAQSSKLQATISSEQALLKNTLTASIDSLFKTDSPALFGASNAESTDGSTLTGLARLRSDGRAIVEYLRIHPVRSIALLAWLVLVFATLHLLRPRVEAKISEQPVLRSVRWLLQDPLSVAVLTTVTMAAVVLPYPPASLNLLLGLVALAPTVQLLRQVVERSLATYLYWLLAMFAFNQVPEILKFDPTWERLFFQSQLLLTILVLMHLTRDRRRAFVQERAEAEAENETVSSEALPPDSSTRHVDQNARSLRLTGYAINTVLAGCSAALVTDLLGFTRLARFISASTLNSLFAGVILLAGSLVLLSLLRLAGNLRPLNRLKMLDEDGALIEARLRRVVYWVAVLLWTGYTLNQVMLLSPLTDALGNFLSTPLKIGQISVSLADLLRFFVLVWLTLQVSRLLRYVLDREVYTRVSLAPGIPYALNSILNYVVLIGGLLMAIASTGVSLDRFTIFASALGVGVGFGLQSIVNNFVSGLIVLFERPIKVGDSVDMAGQSGKVKRIGIRASVLRTGAGADVIVPNSQLIANQVVNWTLSDHLRRIEIGLGLAYDSDPKQVIKLLTEVAREHADLLATPAPTAQFTDFGASALQFKLYAWTARSERMGGIRSELCIAIHERLQAEGIVLATS